MMRALDPSRRLRWRQRFQVRLLGYLLLLTMAMSATTGYIFYSRQVKFVRAEQEIRGRTLIKNLAGQSQLGTYTGDQTFLRGPAQRIIGEPDVTYVVIYNKDGKALLTSTKPGIVAPKRPSDETRRQLSAIEQDSILSIMHSAHRDLLAPVTAVASDAEQSMFGNPAAKAAELIGFVRVGLSRRPAQAKLNEVRDWGMYLAMITLFLGTVLAIFLARRVSQPILALARGADDLRQGALGQQIDIDRRDELGLLADSFNKMSAQLQQTVESLAHLNRNLEQEVARRTVALRRSRDFIALLNAPLQLEPLLDTALDALLRITGAIAGAAFVSQKGDLSLAVCQGMLSSAFAEADDPALICLKTAAAQKSTTLIDPLPRESRLHQQCPSGRQMLCAPLRFQDRLQAVVMLVLVTQPNNDQADFVTHASSQLAIAVANARAYAQAERLAHDLEERNLELLQQRDAAHQLNKLKSEFLANMSHELRTPLNAIIGYSELIADGVYGDVSDEQQEGLNGVHESASHLLQLINDILDLSKVEAGKMSVDTSRMDLLQTIRDVVSLSAPLVRDKPYEVTTLLPTPPLIIENDQGKIRQILVNLVGNAIKFTEDGSVTVRVRRQGNHVLVDVIDSGLGIQPSQIDLIFDEFRQADGSSTRRHGGTGLGLAISRKLAQLCGGDLTVKSTPGRGSTFTLSLPLSRPDSAERPRSKTSGSRRTGSSPALSVRGAATAGATQPPRTLLPQSDKHR
ncbi:MAG: HAMP domain-containing protein [Deltaproteobacteria bacterium]|nr:HAMP domain-containing protein [Deltaproteobacteria bacterium]